MRDISAAELYGFYLDTLGRCTSELRHQSDENIQYELFEEFDVGAHSFLHEDNLVKLRCAGYIDDEILDVSKEVRERWLALQNKFWTMEDIRNKREWEELFELCDRLKCKLKHLP